jgi:urease accessory protein UreH
MGNTSETVNETEMQYRDFTVTGRVYSGNKSHAKHSVYWAIRNSEQGNEILIDNIKITERQTNHGQF